jgi:hypothetical protein
VRVSAEQSVQRRERQLCLGLHTSEAGYVAVTRLSADAHEHRSLADDPTPEGQHTDLAFAKGA